MRKLWITVLLLCLLPVAALAGDIMPAEVQAMIDEYYGQRLPAEYVEIVTEDGRRESIAIIEGGSVLGFENAAGRWEMTLQCFVMDELRPACVEHVAGDDLAIHITKEDGTARLTYRFDGTEFCLAGWVIPGYRPVTIEGDMLTYGEGNDAFSTIVPGGVTNWPFFAEDLPLTPETALALAAITEQNVAGMFPGYTMRGYVAYNDGFMAEAVYARVDDGWLRVRRAFFEVGMEVQYTDCMPIPLSAALLTRLQLEPFDELIYCWLEGETFLTQDAFSREAFPLPAGAVILQNRLEKDSLVVLAEVEGVKRLYIFDENTVAVGVTQPLPDDVYLDFFHSGDGVVQFEWDEQNMTAAFARRGDGVWTLSWCTCWGPEMDIHFSVNAFGVTYFDPEGNERMRIGTLKDTDLFSIRLSDLDGTTPEIDQTGWAVVNNPDPADRLHLRAKASKSGRSLGKFYNGTPVRVLERKGDWTRVQIGFGDSSRTGWMMTKYLAFGADMDKVHDAFPELTFREEYEAHNSFSGAYWVVGVEEEGRIKQYILLGTDGKVLYVQQKWLWGGNG